MTVGARGCGRRPGAVLPSPSPDTRRDARPSARPRPSPAPALRLRRSRNCSWLIPAHPGISRACAGHRGSSVEKRSTSKLATAGHHSLQSTADGRTPLCVARIHGRTQLKPISRLLRQIVFAALAVGVFTAVAAQAPGTANPPRPRSPRRRHPRRRKPRRDIRPMPTGRRMTSSCWPTSGGWQSTRRRI